MTERISHSKRLHDELGRLIAGTPAGERLPSEPVLAQKLGVSRATLREAMLTFETQGLVNRRQGSGTYVLHPVEVFESGLEVLESIESIARRKGLQVTMGDLRIETRPASEEEVSVFSLAHSQNVLSLARVILTEARPVAYLVDVLPEDMIQPEDLQSSFTGSVLDLLLKRGNPGLSSSRTEINAIPCSAEIARLLGIQRGGVLLYFEARLSTILGRVVDYSHSYFLPGFFRFHIIRKVTAAGIQPSSEI